MTNFFSKKYFSLSATAIFYPLLIIFIWYNHSHFELTNFKDFVIGIASTENFDIAARISFYYKAILLATVFIFIFWVLFYHVFRFLRPQRGFLLCFEYLSLAGLIFLFGNIFTNSFSDSWKIVLVLQLVIIILICVSIVIKHEILWLHHAKKIVIAVFTIAFSLTWFLYETANLFELKWLQHFLPALFLISILIFAFILKRSLTIVYRLVYAAVPLLFLPLLSVVKTEMVFILMRHNVLNIHASMLWLLGASILFLVSIIIYLRRSETLIITKRIITHTYLFWLVFGITTIALYKQNFDLITEQFELSNPGIAVMSSFKFHLLPYFDYFNTHLISEILFPFLYAILNNGCLAQEFTIYNFMPLVLANALTYFFVLKFSRNSFLAIAITLMFFLFPVLFPFYMFLAGVLSFLFVLKKQSWFSYWLFACVMLLLATWQLDIGFTSVSVFLLMIACGTVFHFIKIEWKKLLTTFLTIFVSIGIIVFTIALIRHVDLFYKLRLIVEFTGSVQGYGFKTVYRDFVSAVQIQYIFFPAAAVIILVYFLLNRKQLMLNPHQKNQIIMLMLLLMYALINYQRGITRHCFYEWWDKHVSSFLFFAIPASVILLSHKQFSTRGCMALFASVIFLLLGFKYTAYNVGNNFVYNALNQLTNKKTEAPIFRSKTERYEEPPEYTASYKALKDFMDNHFSREATFVDFSNSPVLYMNLNRRCPNYFNQPLFSSQNDYLQNEFTKQLKNFDVPVCVYSNSPANYWDRVDEVPNAVHHAIINQYLFEHYSPYTVLCNHSIWLRNDLFTDSVFNNPPVADAESFAAKKFYLNQLPLVQAKYFERTGKKQKPIEQLHFDKSELTDVVQTSIKNNFTSRKNQYLSIQLESNLIDTELICVAFFFDNKTEGEFCFNLNPLRQSSNYSIRLSDQYNWYKSKCDRLAIIRQNRCNGLLKTIDAKIVVTD